MNSFKTPTPNLWEAIRSDGQTQQSTQKKSTIQAMQVIAKLQDNPVSENEGDATHSFGAVLIEVKSVNSQYLIQQIIALSQYLNFVEVDIMDPNLQEKEKEYYEERKIGKLKLLIGSLTQGNVMDFLLNGSYQLEILNDFIYLGLKLYKHYLLKDRYKSGESALYFIFLFLSNLSLRPEAQTLLFNNNIFLDLSLRYAKVTQQQEVFWQREIYFLTLLSNILGSNEITDFTDNHYLQLSDILIQFYDYLKMDHTEAKKVYEKNKRKEFDKRPPPMFQQGQEIILPFLSVLPAYLIEFAAQVKLKFIEKLEKTVPRHVWEKDTIQKQQTMLSIICRMCQDTLEKNELSKKISFLIDFFKEIIQNASSITKRKILQFFRMYALVNDMKCWIKFSSPHLAIDSTGRLPTIVQLGNPRYIGQEIGLYQKWAGYFDEGDVLYLKDRVKFDKMSQIKSFSVSLWFIYPLRSVDEYLSQNINAFDMPVEADKFDLKSKSSDSPSKQFRTFLQCESGVGCMLGIQGDSRLVFFDDEFRIHSFDMVSKNIGWNNVILKVDNTIQNVKILLNRKEIANRFNVTISRNIAFIGNTLERTEPAGVICDLRIFDSIIPDELVEKIVHYNKIESLPEFLQNTLEKSDVCSIFDETIEKSRKDDYVLMEVLNCISSLSTNLLLKNRMIAQGLFLKVVTLSYHPNFLVRVASQRAILHLN